MIASGAGALLSMAGITVAWTGVATSSIYACLVAVAADRFRRRRVREAARPTGSAPAVAVLKPLHGAEPGLRENLQSFFEQQYSGPYEIVFCARHANDAGLATASELIQQFPSVQARILTCGEPLFPNPKMYSIAVMADTTAAEYVLTSDADARVSPGFVQRIVEDLCDPSVDLSFSLYLAHTDTPTFALWLEVLGKSVEMNAGVLVADMLEGTKFSLGVTVLQRRDVFEKAGGFASLGSYWAEDFVLGNRLAGQGCGVRISTQLVRLMVTATDAKHSFLNQLRWMQSTRRSRPWGHLGTGLTYAAPFALLGTALELYRDRPVAGALLLLFALANRWLLSASVLHALDGGRVLWQCLFYPVRDLYGFVLWAASFLPADTRYHGTQFRIMPDGQLLRYEPRNSAVREH